MKNTHEDIRQECKISDVEDVLLNYFFDKPYSMFEIITLGVLICALIGFLGLIIWLIYRRNKRNPKREFGELVEF